MLDIKDIVCNNVYVSKERERFSNMASYGIIHNNHWYFWHPLKKDGTPMKKKWHKKIWVNWSGSNPDVCQCFDSAEKAQEVAEGLFYNPNSFRIVELDEDAQPIITKDLEELGYGEPLPDAL